MKLLTLIAFKLTLLFGSVYACPTCGGIIFRAATDTSVTIKSRIDSLVASPSPTTEDVLRTSAINSLLARAGTRVIYCTYFYSGRYIKDLDVTVLYLGGNYPNQILTLLIEGKNRAKFKIPPETRYINTGLCIKGILLNNKGNPEIIITDPGQIEVTSKSTYPIN